MDVSDNILKAGVYLRRLILDIPDLGTTRIFPIIAKVDQPKPFITFYRAGLDESAVKSGRGPRTAHFVVQIYSDSWEEGIEIASLIADRLDGYQDDYIQSCRLADAPENFDPTVPANIQILFFTVKI